MRSGRFDGEGNPRLDTVVFGTGSSEELPSTWTGSSEELPPANDLPAGGGVELAHREVVKSRGLAAG